MKDGDRKIIEEIMAGMKCPKDFKCAESGFEKLCKAKDLSLKHYLVCLDETLQECPFSLPFGGVHLCQCPLRVYLSTKLGDYVTKQDSEQ